MTGRRDVQRKHRIRRRLRRVLERKYKWIKLGCEKIHTDLADLGYEIIPNCSNERHNELVRWMT